MTDDPPDYPLVLSREMSLTRVTAMNREALALQERPIAAGRGHRRNEPNACYSSEDEQTAIAEVLHHSPDFEGAPMRISTLEGRLAVLDACDPRVLDELHVDLDDLLAESLEACQDFAARAWDLGAQAIRLPSARASGVNVIVEHFSALEHLTVVSYRIGVLTTQN